MGVLRFLVHTEQPLDNWTEWSRAYISGFDGRVFATQVACEGDVLSCRRPSSESGKLHVAWPVDGFGRPVLSTASLREQDEPYVLAVELARGKVGQVRNQAAAWQQAGMLIPDEFQRLHREAQRLFAKAVSRQHEPAEASRLAAEVLCQSCASAELLTQSYVRQRLAVRRHRSGPMPVLLGFNLARAVPSEEWPQQLGAAFTAAIVPIAWWAIEPVEGEYDWELDDAQVAWCQQRGLLIRGGPLLDLSPDGLPPWLAQWQHDVLNLQSFVCDFIETALARYAGRIRTWEVAAHANTGGALSLTEEDRLTVVARALETARQVDEVDQLLVRVDRPWGDYQAGGEHLLSPLQFVDALVRSGAGLTGVDLEIGVGYHPRGSRPRDLLDISRLIDMWSTLGVPLYVTLAFPSAGGDDPQARTGLAVDANGWKRDWSELAQAEWIDQHVSLLMAKQSVVGVFWSHVSDAAPHDFPHAGLLRPDGSPKVALEHLMRHRHNYP